MEETLAAALEREHREIDAGIEEYAAARGHGETRAEPLARAVEALRRHIYLEEEFLFPPLREAGMMPPVFVMLREHGELWHILDRIDAELAADAGAPALPGLCAELVPRLEAHNTKEETILYARADAVLQAEATAQLREFLASARMPEGWVAQRA